MSLSLVKAIFINRAPFEHLVLDFKEKGINVLSAINGRGKTTVLSHIVDAFYEMSKPSYTYSFEGKENKYYRFSAPIFHLNPSKYSIVYFRFKDGEEMIDYLDCRGRDLTIENYESEIKLENRIPFEISNDPFYSKSNIEHLKRGISAINQGKGREHELIEE